eukprot:gene3282-4111_t
MRPPGIVGGMPPPPHLFNPMVPPPPHLYQGPPFIPPNAPGMVPPPHPNGLMPPGQGGMGMVPPFFGRGPPFMPPPPGVVLPPHLMGSPPPPGVVLPPHPSLQMQLNNQSAVAAAAAAGGVIHHHPSHMIMSPATTTTTTTATSKISIPGSVVGAEDQSKSKVNGDSQTTSDQTQQQQQQPKTTTVYVGKIPPVVEDEFIRKLLEQCGKVAKWNRASGKGFGFCEYESPEGALRALRLLSELEIDEKKLLVKVEDKVQKFLNEYVEKKKKDLLEKKSSPSKKEGEEQTIGDEEQEEGKTDKQQQNDQDTTAMNEDKDDFENQENEDLIIRETLRTMIAQNAHNIYIKKMETLQEQNDFYNKDRKDLTREEKIKVIEKEKEKEKEREKERESKRRERDLRDFREKERLWESRERSKEKEREREKEREKERVKTEKYQRQLEMEEYSDTEERMRKRLRSRDSIKQRQREKEDDEKDRLKEQQEIEQQRQHQQEMEILNRVQLDLTGKKAKLVTNRGFSTMEQDEPEFNQTKKKQNFIPLDFSDDILKNNNITNGINSNNNNNNNQKQQQQQQQQQQIKIQKTKEEIQEMISKLPSEKEDVFAMALEWDIIDKYNIIDQKMQPWIMKKVIEFFGGKEDAPLDYIDYIINLLKERSPPKDIISKLQEVFDNEAESFVIRMWRMFLFNIVLTKEEYSITK